MFRLMAFWTWTDGSGEAVAGLPGQRVFIGLAIRM